MQLPYDPGVDTSGYLPQTNENDHIKTCTRMFIEALFVYPHTGNKPDILQWVNEEINYNAFISWRLLKKEQNPDTHDVDKSLCWM